MDFDEVREYVAATRCARLIGTLPPVRPAICQEVSQRERELTMLLLVDISASGHFGSAAQSKRELAAECQRAGVLRDFATADKVGLLLYSDRVEQYLPPKKGRRHVLRLFVRFSITNREVAERTREGA